MIKQTLLKYKVPLFLISLAVVAFGLFFALTLSPSPTQPVNNTTQTPDQLDTTTSIPDTPQNTSQIEHLQLYENTYRNGATIQKTLTIQQQNRTIQYQTKFNYQPNQLFYFNRTSFVNGSQSRTDEEYYTQENAYQRTGDQINPDKITNQSIETLNVEQRLQIRKYLETQPDKWVRTKPQTYQIETTLQNTSYTANYTGSLTITSQYTEEGTLQRLTVTINPTETTTRYGNTATIIYTISDYTEPQFYWKDNINTSTETETETETPTPTPEPTPLPTNNSST